MSDEVYRDRIPAVRASVLFGRVRLVGADDLQILLVDERETPLERDGYFDPTVSSIAAGDVALRSRVRAVGRGEQSDAVTDVHVRCSTRGRNRAAPAW